MVKPDGVERGLVGEVIKRFEQKGFDIAGMKYVTPSKEHIENHYAEHKGKPFFDGLVSYMTSGPVVPMVWEGRNIIEGTRSMIGATNPIKATQGTIRGDFAIDTGRNLIHGSDSKESADREIKHWFKEEEIFSGERNANEWVYE